MKPGEKEINTLLRNEASSLFFFKAPIRSCLLLLTGSRLISLPLATQMFQFAKFENSKERRLATELGYGFPIGDPWITNDLIEDIALERDTKSLPNIERDVIPFDTETDENTTNLQQVPPTPQASHTLSTIKLPILKKGEYDIWAMKMEHYLEHTDYPIWEVIQKGNGLVQVSTDTNGQIKVLPPKTVEEILAREKERKARTTLLMAIPEDHLAKFHKMTDAKETWEAIKSIFGGNDESKKMHKYIIKQQFESFSVSNSEGLHKGYDMFQSLLSQPETHGVDTLSFDNLYNNLRVFESDVKVSIGSSSSTQNVAFVSSDNTSSTNEVNTAYGVSTSSGHNSQKEGSSSYTDDLISKGNQDNRRRDAGNTRYKVRDNRKRPAKQDGHKAMVTIDGEGVDWTGHAEDDTEDYALMAFISSHSGSDTEVTSCLKVCEESYAKLKKLYDEQREQLGDASIEIQAYTLALKKVEAQFIYHQKNQLAYEEKIRSSDVKDSPVNDRFAKVKGMHVVLPHMTGNYMPPKFDFGIDDSSEETLKTVPKPVESRPKVVNEPKFWYDAPIIEEYESDNDDEYVSKASVKQEKPSCAFINTIKHVKTPRKTIQEQDTCSQNHKVDQQDWTGLKSKRMGLGYGYTKKACFVCGSFSHLIRDCDFHEKRMAKQVELNKQKGKSTGPRENRPDNPHQTLKGKGIVDSRCSRHITGNKAYLVDYQDFNSGLVAFRGSKGQACLIANATLDESTKWHRRMTKPVLLVIKESNTRPPAEAVNTACYVLNRILVIKPQKKTPYEFLTGKISIMSYLRPFGCHVTILNTIGHLGKFKETFDEGFLVGYSLSSKAFRPITTENKANKTAGPKETNNSAVETLRKTFAQSTEDLLLQAGTARANSTNYVNTASSPVNIASTPTNQDDSQIPSLEDIYEVSRDGIFTSASYDDEGAVAGFTNLETTMNVDVMQEELLQFKIQKIWILVDLPFGKKAIGIKWVYRNKKDERGAIVRNKARSMVGIEVMLLTSAKVKTINDEVRIQALVDRKRVNIKESSIIRTLRLDDAEGTSCLTNIKIFEGLAKMGYENPSDKLTFYKAFFSPQWKFSIHTILQCLSAKTTSWNEFSSTMASAIICTGFFGEVTPLFENMLVQAPEEVGILQADAQSIPITTEPLTSKPKRSTYQEGSILKNLRLEEENRVLKELKSVHSTDDTDGPVMKTEKSSKQGRKIADIDADVEINLEKAQAEAYNLDLDHQENVLSMMDVNEKEPADVEEVLEVVKAAKLMTKVVTTAGATKVSVPRKKRGVIIQDLEKTTTTATMQPKVQVKDKGKTILIEEPEPLKRPLFKKHYNFNQTFLDEVNERVKVSETEVRQEKDVEVEISKREDATPLASKIPIVDYKIHTKRNRPYFKIIRADGNHMFFISLSTMLKNFDREDLKSLWKIIFLLVERMYPLTHFTLEQMLNNVRLQVENESEMSLELLRLVRRQLNESYYCSFNLVLLLEITAGEEERSRQY
nr:ribonuclease H-like domain-containing protein [Tanacetum cinerariifolium]